jgi:hypothetical protein
MGSEVIPGQSLKVLSEARWGKAPVRARCVQVRLEEMRCLEAQLAL